MRYAPLITAALLSLSTFACGGSQSGQLPGEVARPPQIGEAKSALARESNPQVSDAAKAQVVQDNTEFALALFKQTAKADENLIQSPLSLTTALAMTYAGAAGQTKSEMAEALRFRLPDAELHAALNWLDLQIQSRAAGASGKDGKPARVNIDNLLFSAKDAQFVPSYLDVVATNYGAGVQLVDFAAQQTLGIINGWVSDRTEKRIPELLAKGSIGADTRLVLLNTVYINSAWMNPFQKELTESGTFYGVAGESQAQYMQQTESFGYLENDEVQVLEVPLETTGLTMNVILPKDGTTLVDLEAGLSAEKFSAWMASIQPESVYVKLPKFKLEPANGGSLKKELQALGMMAPFAAADFSAMMSGAPEISDVIHKTFFEIDEAGLEAAAATAVIMRESAAMQSKTMDINRPFLVALRDKPTGQVLFFGHIVKL